MELLLPPESMLDPNAELIAYNETAPADGTAAPEETAAESGEETAAADT